MGYWGQYPLLNVVFLFKILNNSFLFFLESNIGCESSSQEPTTEAKCGWHSNLIQISIKLFTIMSIIELLSWEQAYTRIEAHK